MATRLPLLILTVSTIFLLIGMCVSLPYRRDTAIAADNCDKSVPHVVIINSTTGEILNCHKCVKCEYSGHGLSIPCHGQNVTLSQINIECVPCVSGMNYSTGEMGQCQPCLAKKCKAGEKMVGKCESDGDNQTCKSCELDHWYYNDTQKMCLPCVCHNMTAEVKQICKQLGFRSDVCGADGSKTTTNIPTSTTTNTPNSVQNDENEVWGKKYTIIMIVSGIVALLGAFFCYVIYRAKKLKIEHPGLSACSQEWFCRIFCFKEATRSRPPSYTVEDRHAQNGNGTERTSFLRQCSCPVTQNEKYAVINTPHAVAFKQGDGHEHVELLFQECKQQKLKFFDMNSETCRVILQALKHNIEAGMGYNTLAGYMGFSANEVKSFEENGKPCEKMLKCWSDLDSKQNNVLKLKDLVEKLKRDDILELLKSELRQAKKKCGCPECVAV